MKKLETFFIWLIGIAAIVTFLVLPVLRDEPLMLLSTPVQSK